MPDTKDMAAFAWDGHTVYGDNESVKAVARAAHDAATVPDRIEHACRLRADNERLRGELSECSLSLARNLRHKGFDAEADAVLAKYGATNG